MCVCVCVCVYIYIYMYIYIYVCMYVRVCIYIYIYIYIYICMYVCMYVKCRYFCQILMKHEFSRQIPEKFSNIYFFKLRPTGAEYFDADGQMTKLIVAFCSSTNTP